MKKTNDELLKNSLFLSVFYTARKRSEDGTIPLPAAFMEIGLNKYKTWFPKICLEWGIENLTQIIKFDKWVRTI
jgi:hypothetical protein